MIKLEEKSHFLTKQQMDCSMYKEHNILLCMGQSVAYGTLLNSCLNNTLALHQTFFIC